MADKKTSPKDVNRWVQTAKGMKVTKPANTKKKVKKGK